MVSKIQKWGNSQGLRFPKEILKKLHLSVGDEVEISVKKSEIVVKAKTRIRNKYKLKDLLADLPEENETKEFNWGKAEGKEIW